MYTFTEKCPNVLWAFGFATVASNALKINGFVNNVDYKLNKKREINERWPKSPEEQEASWWVTGL